MRRVRKALLRTVEYTTTNRKGRRCYPNTIHPYFGRTAPPSTDVSLRRSSIAEAIVVLGMGHGHVERHSWKAHPETRDDAGRTGAKVLYLKFLWCGGQHNSTECLARKRSMFGRGKGSRKSDMLRVDGRRRAGDVPGIFLEYASALSAHDARFGGCIQETLIEEDAIFDWCL